MGTGRELQGDMWGGSWRGLQKTMWRPGRDDLGCMWGLEGPVMSRWWAECDHQGCRCEAGGSSREACGDDWKGLLGCLWGLVGKSREAWGAGWSSRKGSGWSHDKQVGPECNHQGCRNGAGGGHQGACGLLGVPS